MAIPRRIPKSWAKALRNAQKGSKKTLREHGPQSLLHYGHPGDEEKTAEHQKEALLARLMAGIASGSRGAGHLYRNKAFRKSMRGVSSGAFEDAMRDSVARKIGPVAIRAADAPLRSFDKLLTHSSRGHVGLSPEFREKLLKFIADHPGTTLGVAGAAVPAPAASELGMAVAGGLSAASKKLLNIPSKGGVAMEEFAKSLWKRGYKDVKDYLVKTKAVPTSLVPKDPAALRAQLSFGPSLV